MACINIPRLKFVVLAWHYPTRTGLDSTQAWYDDIDNTDGVLGADSIYSGSGKALVNSLK